MIKNLLLLCFFSLFFNQTFGQASWEKFGQNRVQYRTFDWSYYDSTHFRTFFYKDGKANALYALSIAEQELSTIIYLMGGRMTQKLNLIIYNSFSDFRQTNLGRKNEEINGADGGKMDMIGENIPIYFNGDHSHLRKQIRKGIAIVIKENMLFGDNLKEALKNSIKMNLPDWFSNGYVAHIADEWTPEMATEVKSLILSSKKKKFESIALSNPQLVGHSFWHFIMSEYGENFVSNLIYLTRYRMSVDHAIESVLKMPSKEAYAKWQTYYTEENASNIDSLDSLQGRKLLARIKTKPGGLYSHFSPSPTGRDVAYVEKLDGQFNVKIIDLKFDKSSTILEGGMRATQELADPNYPLLSWSPTGNKLAVLYQRNNRLNLRIFTLNSNKMENRVISARKIERITGMCFMPEENALAVTAIKKGQSDLYRLIIQRSRIEPISNDLFDDKEPKIIQNEIATGVLFMSNRDNPYLGENSNSDAFNPQFNLYLYDPSKGTNLQQLSDTKEPIHHPIQWGKDGFSYLQHEGGKIVRKVVYIEKRGQLGDTFRVENFVPAPFPILQQEFIQQSSSVIEVTKEKKDFIVYSISFDSLQKRHQLFVENKSTSTPSKDSTQVAEVTYESLPKYVTSFESDSMQTNFLTDIFIKKSTSKSRYQLFTSTKNLQKPIKYKRTFYPDFLQSSLDNTLLFTRYQAFEYGGGQFQNPPLSGFLTTTITDVMEDYKIRGGARLGGDFTSLDYFLQFQNFRRRVDWGVLYFRSTAKNIYDQSDVPPPYFSPFPVTGRVSLDYLQGNLTYPIDMLHSIHVQLGLRMDRIRIKATDQYSIGFPDDHQYWVVNRAEFVYDNTVSPILNSWKGSRFKLFAEYQYKFNGDTKGFYNFGYDARNYATIYKNFILASRIAGAHSGGNAKILYFLGGVDNDVNPKQDQNTAIDYSQNYAFMSLATNLRGYKQGFRNGNSFMVVNEELRLPIYNTFFKRQIKSAFIRNLQMVAFADIGSAWRGILPSEDNISSPNSVVKDPVTVFISKSRYDFGMGYGLGLRSKLFGYFVRSDFAWNIEGGRRPMVHISLATDF